MAIRKEIEDVVPWLAGLLEEKQETTPKPPSEEDWADVRARLDTATENLKEARSCLLNVKGLSPVVVELAGDAVRQSEGLALRAAMLKRRSVPETVDEQQSKAAARAAADHDEDAATKRREKEEADAAARRAPKAREEAERGEQATPPDTAEKPAIEAAIDHLRRAQLSLGTAHQRLNIAPYNDGVTTRFEGELEVLAEFTLSLTQRAEQYEPPPAEQGASEKDGGSGG